METTLSIRASLAVVIVISVLLVGCGGESLSPSLATVAPQGTATATPPKQPATVGAVSSFCSAGQLVVGDLPSIDRKWKAGIDQATTAAHAWQSDAFLTALKVSCQLFEADFRWQATFYSRTAQAYYLSDTTEVIPAGIDPEAVPSLQGQTFAFGAVYRALIKSGYEDTAAISPSTGVDVRLNTDKSSFGPPSAPKNMVIYHLAIQRLGETKDVFVDGSSGSVYRYTN